MQLRHCSCLSKPFCSMQDPGSALFLAQVLNKQNNTIVQRMNRTYWLHRLIILSPKGGKVKKTIPHSNDSASINWNGKMLNNNSIMLCNVSSFCSPYSLLFVFAMSKYAGAKWCSAVCLYAQVRHISSSIGVAWIDSYQCFLLVPKISSVFAFIFCIVANHLPIISTTMWSVPSTQHGTIRTFYIFSFVHYQ